MFNTIVVLLATANLLVCRISSLKLTPVQRTKHRLDISEECDKFLSAVQSAYKKVLDDEMHAIDRRVTLDSDELKKLRLLVNRWNTIDDKLRDINALSVPQNKVCRYLNHPSCMHSNMAILFIESYLRGCSLLLSVEQDTHRKAAFAQRRSP